MDSYDSVFEISLAQKLAKIHKAGQSIVLTILSNIDSRETPLMSRVFEQAISKTLSLRREQDKSTGFHIFEI